MIVFIHIGKTGGTTIDRLLRGKLENYREYHLNIKYKSADEEYIIWLRNPISRFVSAFNHSLYAVRKDVSTMKTFNLKTCLLPYWLEKKKTRGFTFSKKYDDLVKLFKSPNDLAEALSSSDTNLKSLAVNLMNMECEHLFKGIGWYLDNGVFVNKNNSRIRFVGRLENMKEDIAKLSLELGISLNSELFLRENVYVDKSLKSLSPLAITNIVEWYKETDYKALKVLNKKGWVSDETLKSYYTYNND